MASSNASSLHQRLEARDVFAKVGTFALADPLFTVHQAHGLFDALRGGLGLVCGRLGLVAKRHPGEPCKREQRDQGADRSAQRGERSPGQARAGCSRPGCHCGRGLRGRIAQRRARSGFGGHALRLAHGSEAFPDFGFGGLGGGKLQAQRSQLTQPGGAADVVDLRGQAGFLELDLAADQRGGRRQARAVGCDLGLGRSGGRAGGRQRHLRRLLLGRGAAHGFLRGAGVGHARGLLGA